MALGVTTFGTSQGPGWSVWVGGCGCVCVCVCVCVCACLGPNYTASSTVQKTCGLMNSCSDKFAFVKWFWFLSDVGTESCENAAQFFIISVASYIVTHTHTHTHTHTLKLHLNTHSIFSLSHTQT